jgi:4a-hydroxytetrahydrobiopterin dehydratase
MPPLSPAQAALRLKATPLWKRRGRAIYRRFECAGFLDSIDFVNRVAERAEKSDHHPDIDIRWNKVTLALTTHSEGGLTAKDFSMAGACSEIYARHFGPR